MFIAPNPKQQSAPSGAKCGVRWQAQRDTALDVLSEKRIQSAVVFHPSGAAPLGTSDRFALPAHSIRFLIRNVI